MLASARRSITIALGLSLLGKLLTQPGEFFSAAPSDFRDACRDRALSVALADPPILFHDGLAILANVLLHSLDFLNAQYRHDLHNLVVGAVSFEVRDEVLDGNPAGGELRPPAAIDNLDVRVHDV